MTQRSRSPIRQRTMHWVRVMMFVAIVAAIHLNYKNQRAQQTALSGNSRPLTIEDVKDWIPAAVTLKTQEPKTQPEKTIWQQVQSASRNVIAEVSQTSPGGDNFVGFSGPTNLLVVLEPQQKAIQSVTVLSSRDTRDHVEAVVQDPKFLAAFSGISTNTNNTIHSIESIDSVTGATLTSMAIKSTLLNHLGAAEDVPAKFDSNFDLTAVRNLLPNAASVQATENSNNHFVILGSRQEILGYGLRTSPAADDLIGFQGPTDSLLLMDQKGIAIRLVMLDSFDNRPYIDQVAEDDYFLESFEGMSVESIGEFDLDNSDLEGVSGATMTSQTMLAGVQQAAQVHLANVEKSKAKELNSYSWRDVGTAAIVLAGILIAFTSLRSHKWLRRIFQVSMVVGLGLVNGDFVSQALVGGWILHGIPWQVASGLVLLVTVAFLFPITSKKNLYCAHLCPHGALQQWVRPPLIKLGPLPTPNIEVPPLDSSHDTSEKPPADSLAQDQRGRWFDGRRVKLGRRLRISLGLIPGLLIVGCFVVVLFGLPFSLVDIEPFDAWIFRVAGWSSIAIALVGLVASCFVPMAYCQYGCPTGALLQHLRYNGRSSDWTFRDWVALVMLLIAFVTWQFG